MKESTSIQANQDYAGLIGRVAHDLSAALDWLAGPAMSELGRRERDMAEVRRRKCDTSAMHL